MNKTFVIVYRTLWLTLYERKSTKEVNVIGKALKDWLSQAPLFLLWNSLSEVSIFSQLPGWFDNGKWYLKNTARFYVQYFHVYPLSVWSRWIFMKFSNLINFHDYSIMFLLYFDNSYNIALMMSMNQYFFSGYLLWTFCIILRLVFYCYIIKWIIKSRQGFCACTPLPTPFQKEKKLQSVDVNDLEC